MNIKITDLDMILNYLETTSLEPHDDYTSEFTYKDQKILYKYIKQLQQESQKQKDNWNKLREWLKEYKEGSYGLGSYETGLSDGLGDVIKKMHELEQGSDSNEKDN